MDEQLELIEKLLIKHDKHPNEQYLYLTHSIFNVVKIEEIINLYISTPNTKLRNTLRNYLPNRLNDKSIEHAKIFNRLMNRIHKSGYHEHQRIRIVLAILISKLSKRYTQRFFDYFLSSEYAWDKEAALKVSNIVWNTSSDEVFLNLFLESGNQDYIKAVIAHGNAKYLSDRIFEIWQEDLLFEYIKNRIIRKLAPNFFQNLEFLKEIEPDKYLYACGFADKHLNEVEIKDLFDRLGDDQKTFGLWCIGKLKEWNFLKEQLKYYIS